MTLDLHRPGSDVPNGMVQPQMILPSQWFARPDILMPERGLMLAVLADAVRCILKYRSYADPRAEQDYVEAEDWLLTDDQSWPYSFEHICEVLTLDAAAVRERLGVTRSQRRASGDH